MTTPKTYDLLIRVSRMSGRDEADASTMTLDDQEQASRRAIELRGGRVGRELRALDQSGFTVTQSPAWREALDRVRRGESAGFAIAYDDRLARNWRKLGPFLDEAESVGAEIIYSNLPGVDYRTDDGRTLTGILAVVSERGFLTARQRGNAIAAATLARGVPNQVPLGYVRNGRYVDGKLAEIEDPERDPKALVPDHATAPVVQAIFKMRAARLSWGAISKTLAEQGIKSPKGGRWMHGSLAAIIEQRMYLGEVRLGNRPPVLDAHQPLVDAALWRQAQSTRRSVSSSGRYRGGLAHGLVTCSSCGVPMSVFGGKGQTMNYGCRNGRSKAPCPRPHYIAKAPVDTWLEDWVLDGIKHGTFEMFATARDVSAAGAAYLAAVERRKRIVATVAEWEPEDAEAAYRAAKAAEDDAKAAHEDLLSRAQDAAHMPTDADAWQALSIDAQRRIVGALLDRIDVGEPISRARTVPTTTQRLTLVAAGGSA